MTSDEIGMIEQKALSIRKNIIHMISSAGSGHPGGSLGQADIFAALYFGSANGDKILKFPRKPLNLLDKSRDILIQSNGHTAPVRYAAFRELGLISDEEILSLRKFGARLQGHPERTILPEVETTSGPLGEGLSQAAGIALAMRDFNDEPNRRVFVTLGDGEMDEGQNWEAIMFARKNRLSNLVAIIDFNEVQLSGSVREIMPLEPLAGKFAAFGWEVFTCDGNNVRELLENFAKILSEKSQKNGKPKVLIAKTKMGFGVPSIMGDYHWHGKAPSVEMAEKWLKELEEDFAKKEEK